MKLIIGLGNPGPEYARTRHNAGFLAIDRLAARHAPGITPKSRFSSLTFECPIRNEKTLLLKPLTFMNLSGRAAAEAIGFYKLNPAADLLVLVDDVALPSGSIRIRPSGSAGGHNGLADIQRALGTETYPRLRIGVDPKPPAMALHDYVLGRFTDEQTLLLGPALEKSCDAVETFISLGLDAAMNRFNKKDEPPTPPPQAAPKPPAIQPSPKTPN